MLSISNDGAVTVVRIEHGKVNALDLELLQAITEVFRTRRDEVIVLTGSGSAFSAGVDLRRLLDGGAAYVRQFVPALDDAFGAVFDHPRPVVAAVNGHAIAGGAVLAAACDVRLMSGGRIGVTELLVGVPFPSAALEIVRHVLGPAAVDNVLTGRTVDAAEAQRTGWVDDVVDPEVLLADAVARAETLARIPTGTYSITKDQLHRPANQLIDAGRPLDDERVLAGWLSTEVADRISAYLQSLRSPRPSD